MTMFELFSKHTKWIQGDFARDSPGKACCANSSLAVCWCLLGAMERCYRPSERPAIHSKMVRYINRGDNEGIGCGQWNDSRGRKFKDVRKLCKTLGI